MDDVDIVIHLAARVHVMKDNAKTPLEEFRRVNVDGTRKLLLAASNKNVKQIIYLSSIAALGEDEVAHLTEETEARPSTPYGVSKWEAENLIKSFCTEKSINWVILRPPMVYGKEAPGNFKKISNLVQSGFPNPLGAIENKRSFIFIENLVDAIISVINDPASNGNIFHVSDNEAISTTELVNEISKNLNKSIVSLPIPVNILKFIGRLLRKEEMIKKLTNDLTVSNTKIKEKINWNPPFTVYEALKKSI